MWILSCFDFFEYNLLKELYDFKYYIYNKIEEKIKNFKQINENQIILVTWKTYNGIFNMGCNTRIKLCDLDKKEIKKNQLLLIMVNLLVNQYVKYMKIII